MPIKAVAVTAIQPHRRMRLRSVPTNWWRAAAAVVGCALVAAAVGSFAKPLGAIESASSSGARVGVLVAPVDEQGLVSARVPTTNAGVPANASYWRGPATYGGYIFATGRTPEEALDFSASSAFARRISSWTSSLARATVSPTAWKTVG